jgi:lysophospholipase-3
MLHQLFVPLFTAELKDYYYDDVTALVEETYNQQDNKSIILVCHSMGCPVMLHYLNHKDQSWKDKYIHSFVTLAAPWGGAVKALKAFTSGDNLGVIVVPALTIRKDERTFPSLAYLMPSDKFWGPDEVLMTNGNKTYTTQNYKELFKDIDYDIGYQMWLDNRNLTYNMTPPYVHVHCIHGVGVNTMETLEYKEDKFPDHNPKIGFGDGDSTVNTRSLEGCLRWKDSNGGKGVQHMNLTGVDHMSVMTDARILKYLLTLATIE